MFSRRLLIIFFFFFISLRRDARFFMPPCFRSLPRRHTFADDNTFRERRYFGGCFRYLPQMNIRVASLFFFLPTFYGYYRH